MKNEKAKIERILEYEKEIRTARDYYFKEYRKKNQEKHIIDGLNSMNRKLEAIKEIRKILDI